MERDNGGRERRGMKGEERTKASHLLLVLK